MEYFVFGVVFLGFGILAYIMYSATLEDLSKVVYGINVFQWQQGSVYFGDNTIYCQGRLNYIKNTIPHNKHINNFYNLSNNNALKPK